MTMAMDITRDCVALGGIIDVDVAIFDKSIHTELPSIGTAVSAGMDLSYSGRQVTIAPHETDVLETNVMLAIPRGYVGIIKDRSSMAAKGLSVRAGVIDADYRGEIKVVIHNSDTSDPAVILSNDRIAQILFVPVAMPVFNLVDSLDETDRGDGGFGSTGR